MTEHTRKRSQKIGKPAGSLVFVGRRSKHPPKISILDYDQHLVEEKLVHSLEEAESFIARDSVTWINIEGVQQVDLVEKVGKRFNLHPLVLEDIVNTTQRPKQEVYPEYIYVVLKMLCPGKDNTILTEQLSIVFGKNYLVSLQEGIEGDIFGVVRERLKNEKSKIRRLGSDYLAYVLIDTVVDYYFATLEAIGEQVEQLEQQVLQTPSESVLGQIYHLKRELFAIRRAVWPVRDIIGALQREDSDLMTGPSQLHLRDVYGHIIEVIELTEMYRDLASGMIEIYLSSINNRLNVVMKVLAVITVIFMPLSFIAGVYGMNFKYMPELEWRYGYPLILGIMFAISGVMIWFFKKRDWI